MSTRFVILAHSGQGPMHYDLMLARGRSLATWHLPCLPADLPPARAVAAEKLADHRAAYLDYEGPVGGNRGEVRRVAAGMYETTHLDADHWQVRLAGSSDLLDLRRAGPDDSDWTITRLAGAEA